MTFFACGSWEKSLPCGNCGAEGGTTVASTPAEAPEDPAPPTSAPAPKLEDVEGEGSGISEAGPANSPSFTPILPFTPFEAPGVTAWLGEEEEKDDGLEGSGESQAPPVSVTIPAQELKVPALF